MANRAIDRPSISDPFAERWYGKLLLLLLSVLLITLALAPIHQFYLAWVGLVPWLWVACKTRSKWGLFLWSWLAGTLYFVGNMWWLVYVTAPGMIALVIYLGLHWAVAAMIFGGLGWLAPAAADQASSRLSPQWQLLGITLGIATVLTALEWVRGTLFTGLPWIFLGHTQSPFLVMCQIADFTGVYGVSFCIAALNALIFLYLRHPQRALWLATLAVVGLWACTASYGIYRSSQMKTVCSPGPTVLLVQPNYPQDNSGIKGAEDVDRVRFHLEATNAALRKAAEHVELTVWSETEMPELNQECRDGLRQFPPHPKNPEYFKNYSMFLDDIVNRVGDLAREYHTTIIAGGLAFSKLDTTKWAFTDRRNSAFIFHEDGRLDAEHSDKIHLVPFGEFIPFRGSHWFGWLHDIFLKFSPYDYDYTLTAGSDNPPTVLSIPSVKLGRPLRFVVPICFEDIDAPLVARMIRGEHGKRADLIVNLTNDGWFKYNQNTQHLQAAIFRSIENRTPTARSVNTGISAFIDSYGHLTATLPVRTEGTMISTVMLDSRYTLYTKYGDVFAVGCVAITIIFIATAVMRHRRARRELKASIFEG
jgi:apolipoprotein N-acyltransferase